MSYLNEAQVLSKNYIGFNGFSTGALPASWIMYPEATSTTPEDQQVVYNGVNGQNYLGRGTSPDVAATCTGYQSSFSVSTSNLVHGYRIGCWASNDNNGFYHGAALWNSAWGLDGQVRLESDFSANHYIVYQCGDVSGTYSFAFVNTYIYFIGLECYDNVVTLYLDTVNVYGPFDAGGPVYGAEAPTAINLGTRTTAIPSGPHYPGAVATCDQSIYHLEFTYFKQDIPPLPGAPIANGGLWNFPQLNSYQRYKGMRQATHVYNNLELGP